MGRKEKKTKQIGVIVQLFLKCWCVSSLVRRLKLSIVLSLFLFLQLGNAVYGKAIPHLNFRHYMIEDGLSVNAIYCMTQDSKGFMWFGSIDGLNRFDGRKFRVLRLPTYEKNITLGNLIYDIVEDKEQRLWIASDRGVCLFDLKTERFLPFTAKTSSGVSIKSRTYAVLIDKKGDVWVGTYGQGLFCYSKSTQKLIQYRHKEANPKSICSDNIRRIYQDSFGKIWFTSLDNGIGEYVSATNSFKNYQPTGIKENVRNEAIFEDSQGNFWIGNDRKGLIKMNRSTGKFTPYLTEGSPQNIKHIRSIIEYAPGILLLASDNGLTFFDISTTQATTLVADRQGLKGLNDSYLHSLYIDKEKGLWIGTYFGGVNYVSLAYNNFSYFGCSLFGNSIPGRIVSAFCEDPNGNLWIGTDDAGLSFFDIRKQSFINYKPIKGKNSLSYQNIHALLCDNQKLWIGTYSGGLDIFDIKTGVFHNYQPDNSPTSLCSSSIYSIYKDKRGGIWIGTTSGLNSYNPATDNFSRIKSLWGKDITFITEDKRGYLWVATFDSGVYRLNVRTGEWKNFTHQDNLSNDKVITICLDREERLWFGTDGGGICRFNYETNRFEPCSLPGFTSSVIHKIISDYDYLWISTNKGLLKYSPDKRTLKIYNKLDGLQSDQFTPNAGIKTVDGRLWFGGINGITSFYPRELVNNHQVPTVVLTNFQLFNKDMGSQEKDSPLEQAIGYTGHLTLTHLQSSFSINFVALSFSAPLKNKYAYKLEGFDKDWIEVTGDPKASYMNLPAGNYVFRVKASNGDGVWNEQGTTLKLEILPPFWRTVWAYIFYVIVLLFSAVYLYVYLSRRSEKRHRAKMEHLKMTKEKELYDIKVNFFTNIVHEIRTPLTLIIGPLESIIKSRKTLDEAQGELSVIQRNSNRLLNLVNQLMDFRKIEEEGFLLKFEKQNLTELVSKVFANFELSTQNRKAKIEFIAPTKNSIVNIDAEALEKILSNLLFNAVKYTKDLITLEVIRKEGLRQVDIRITDNGNGISKEEQDKIFKPFYQVKGGQCVDVIGTGVGLTLARSLTESMNGKLLLDSELGLGAQFTVRLPILPDDTLLDSVALQHIIPIETDEETSDEDASPLLEGRKPVILVVDDNEELRTFIDQQLNAFYQIITVESGSEALHLLKEHHVDLIVSDVMMPEMDGFELCRLVKKEIETSHIPLLLLTAKADIEAKIVGLENGADVYVEKPFSIEFLSAQINSLLSNRERLRQRFVNLPFVASNTIATSKADQELLRKMDDVIEKNMAESDFSVEDLASILCMSRSTLFTKIKNVSGLTPNNYIRLARLKKSAEYVATGEYQINEICYLVGFSSSSYFTKCFKKQFGMLPTEFVSKVKGEN